MSVSCAPTVTNFDPSYRVSFGCIQVTAALKKVADAYGVKFVAGTQMEQITRYGLSVGGKCMSDSHVCALFLSSFTKTANNLLS